jgi:hypothetical protein
LSCRGCRFWTGDRNDDVPGQCRRHAPKPHHAIDGDDDARWAFWPIVLGDDWCGEHEPVPAAPK